MPATGAPVCALVIVPEIVVFGGVAKAADGVSIANTTNRAVVSAVSTPMRRMPAEPVDAVTRDMVTSSVLWARRESVTLQ